MVVGPFTKN